MVVRVVDSDDIRRLVSTAEAFAVKIATRFHRNAGPGLPASGEVTMVHDAVTGALFTELRTGVVAADLPAKPDARSAAVIGAGGQARYQLPALLKARRVEQVTRWGRRQAAEQYQRDKATTGVPGKYVPDSIAAADSGELHHALGAGLLVAGSVCGEPTAGVGAAARPHRGRRPDRGRPGRPGHQRRGSGALADEHGTGRDVPRGDC